MAAMPNLLFEALEQWLSQELKFTGAQLGHKTISEKLEFWCLLGVHVTSLSVAA